MENQPPTTNASAWLNRKPAAPEHDASEAEIARLKERLQFYESFDQLIQENVSRAGELLRHAAATRENAEQQIAATRREMEELRAGDRQEMRSVLSGLLDDVTTMQVQIERLARRVADALDDIELAIPAGMEAMALTASQPALPDGEPQAPLPIEPTMDELLPPEPAGEAQHGLPDRPPAIEVETDVVAAEAETEIDSTEPINVAADADQLIADSTGSEGDQPDTTLVMDEVVQEPTSQADATSTEDESDEPPLGDGVISGETRDDDHDQRAPAAPAEENTVETAAQELVNQPHGGDDADTSDSAASVPATPPKLPWLAADVRPFAVEGAGGSVRRPGTGELRSPQPASRTASAAATPPSGLLATAVLVHGVPRATTALSLKRYLEGLSHVSAVEPREYAEGVLRLHVTGERPLRIDDLRGWSDGSSIEPLHVRDDLIEVRLPN